VSQDNRQRAAPAITSTSNEQVRFVKSLYVTNVRRREKLFVVEGVRLLEEALGAGVTPEFVLVAPEQLTRTPRGAALYERLKNYPCQTVTEPVLKSISDTVTPQGVIAVVAVPHPNLASDLGPVIVILDRLRDPGNAGAILRSADASGIVRTVAFVDSVDAYSPKVVRAAMGSHFRLTILEDAQWKSLLPILGGRPRYLASATGGTTYDRVDWTRPCALILGGEADGAGEEATNAANARVTIPMAGPTESLNAAIAGSILLFEAARARRPKDSPAETRPAPTRPIPAPVTEAEPEAPPRRRTPFARSFDREIRT
jgi:TrmH family RNA methyltransferase